ncbi:oligosaccharide flippase family protein [Massilimicrobiota timonensis]|uniref:lipopolysaccharide biosynthesis protein n=1 Tax=Massilimicrobiota timonensis TaxID=1776392 RepID=UPI0036F43FAE
MNKYIKLIRNIGIFTIGNLGSKFLTFLIVPLYTYVLTTEEYGLIDTTITLVSLFLPFFTCAIYEAILRYTLNSKYTKEEVFTNCFIVLILGFLIFIFVMPIINLFIDFNFLLYFILLLITQGIYTFFQQFSKGIDRNQVYTISGLIYTFIMLLLNVLFLVNFKMGIPGYFLSMIIGYTISSIYITITTNIFKYFKVNVISKESIKVYLKYSIPLVPNSIMWWVMNASSKFFILYFLDLSANGIYAIAFKIPTVISMFSQIFFQAWQISAVEEENSSSKSTYYSKIYNLFSIVMFGISSFLLVVLKPLILNFFSQDYIDAWEYIPFLILAVVFSSFSSFIGVNYIVSKKTSGVFTSSLIGAIANCIFNILLIPCIGLYGASIATLLSYFIMWIIRYRDTKKQINIKINKFAYLFNILIITFQIILLYIPFSNNLIFVLFLFIILAVVDFYQIYLSFKRI